MPTDTELLDLDGVSRRASTVRFDLLDASLAKIGVLFPSRDDPPTISNNINRTIKRSMDGLHLAPGDQDDVDTITNRIRPVWVLAGGTEYPLGVFLWADATRRRLSYGLPLEGAMVDQCMILDQPLATGVSYDRGTTITTAISELTADIPSRSITTSTRTVGNPIAWRIGTTRFSVLADLCGMIGYFSPYFDSTGTMICKPATDLSSATADHTYASGTRIVAGSMIESDDLISSPNRYVVVGSGANAEEVSGLFDVPDSAPYSYANRGFYVTDVWESQGVTSAAQAAEAAAARYAQDSSTYRWVDFEATPDPRHDTFDVVSYLGVLYREQSWELHLREGSRHRHSLRRIY